jgi:hypothetical protein
MSNSSIASQLDEVKPDAMDRDLARLIARAAIERERIPYRFSINHDIRPPRNLRCPVDYDWALKDRVGIDTPDRMRTLTWLTDVLMLGYTIREVDDKHRTSGLLYSIAAVRERAAYHQRPKPVYGDDDDIPY